MVKIIQRRVPVGSAASALETCISNRPTAAVPKPPATGRVSAKSVGANAAIAGLYMSAQARLSKRLRIVVAATPVATIISDPRLPENPIIAVNQAFLDLSGYGPDEVLDRNCRFLSGLGTEPWLTERIREGVRDHHPVLVEILNYKKGGVPFRNAVLVAPIYDEDDELLYFLGAQIEIVGCAQSISENRRERAVQCLSQLTPRQLEVTKLVAQGLLNKQIAGLLGLSIKTVKMHRGLVMTRLELRNQADLIRLAVEAGL